MSRRKPTAQEIAIAKRIREYADKQLAYFNLPWYKRIFTRRPR